MGCLVSCAKREGSHVRKLTAHERKLTAHEWKLTAYERKLTAHKRKLIMCTAKTHAHQVDNENDLDDQENTADDPSCLRAWQEQHVCKYGSKPIHPSLTSGKAGALRKHKDCVNTGSAFAGVRSLCIAPQRPRHHKFIKDAMASSPCRLTQFTRLAPICKNQTPRICP